MSDYCYREELLPRYSDADFKDELKLSSLLAFAQEVACRSADELGFGYDALKPLRYAFLVISTYCEFRRPISYDERLTLETWPLPPRHGMFERDYRIKKGEEEVAVLSSLWCLIDFNTMLLLPAEKLPANDRCPYRAEKTVVAHSRKLPKLKEGREVYRMTVKNGDCDHYLHANNTKYADFFINCFSMEELSRRKIKAFQIVYLKQVKEGEELCFFREDGEGSTLLEARANGEVTTQFKVWFEEK